MKDLERILSDEDITKIKTKYNIIYFEESRKNPFNVEDLPEHLKCTVKSHRASFNYADNIPIFKDIKLDDISKNCKDVVVDGLRLCFIPKGTSIYKGMDYFYDSSIDAKYQTFDSRPTWYSTLETAASYSNSYQGGINAYKTKEDIHLLRMDSYENLLRVSHFLKTQHEKDVLCLKTGVGCDILEQIDHIMKINRWDNDIWLQKHNTNRETRYNRNIREYRILKNDILFTKILQKFFSDKFDGFISSDKIVSPFYQYGSFSEIAMFNQKKLFRDLSNKYDWTNWQKYLPVKIPDSSVFILAREFSKKNGDFRVMKFYQKNMPMDLTVKNKDGYKILTFNAHMFESINTVDSIETCFKSFIKLIKSVNPDIAGVQEIPGRYIGRIKQELSGWNILYTKNGSHQNNKNVSFCFLLTRHPVVKHKIVVDYEKKRHRNSIFALIKLNKKIRSVIVTHLPVGYRHKTTKYLNEITETYEKNYSARKKFLNNLLQYKPKILLGDFNFSPCDKEKEVIKGTGYENGFNVIEKNIKYTTPFGTVVDYVLVNTPNRLSYQTIKYNLSDHLPLLCTVDRT